MNADAPAYEVVFDEDQLFVDHGIDSFLSDDDCLLDDIILGDDALSFVEDDFPMEYLNDDMLDEASINSEITDNSSLTESEGESLVEQNTAVEASSVDSCRAVSPEPHSTSPNTSLYKLNACMERSALSRSLVERYCKTKLFGNLKRGSTLKSRVNKRRRSSIRSSRTDNLFGNTLLPRNVSLESSIGSFLRNKRTRSYTAVSTKNGSFQLSGLKSTRPKFEILDTKVSPIRKNVAFPLPKSQSGIASFLRRQQLDPSARRYGAHSRIEQVLSC